MESLYADTIAENSAAPNWLRDRLSGWYATWFPDMKSLPAETRQLCGEALHAWRELIRRIATLFTDIQQTLPAVMRWSTDLQQARGQSADHYALVLDTAAQLSLLEYEAEQGHMAEERTIHRYNMKETDAEAVLRQIQELKEKLTVLQEEQMSLDKVIGGRMRCGMLGGFAKACAEELTPIESQAEEAKRIIDHAEAIATPEELPKVDAARARLHRMERHLAVLRGRSAKASADYLQAQTAEARSAYPELVGATADSSALFPESLLYQLSLVHDKRDRRQLETQWPWDNIALRDLAAAVAEPDPTLQYPLPLGRFLQHVLQCTGMPETRREAHG